MLPSLHEEIRFVTVVENNYVAQIPAVESNQEESLCRYVVSVYTCQQDQLKSINECLKAIGETSVVKLVHTGY